MSPRSQKDLGRRPVTREEMITSGRLKQTVHASSPRLSSPSGTSTIADEAAGVGRLGRQVFATGCLGEADSSNRSVLTLLGPMTGVNDTESVATDPEVHMIQDL